MTWVPVCGSWWSRVKRPDRETDHISMVPRSRMSEALLPLKHKYYQVVCYRAQGQKATPQRMANLYSYNFIPINFSNTFTAQGVSTRCGLKKKSARQQKRTPNYQCWYQISDDFFITSYRITITIADLMKVYRCCPAYGF
jgi:hypothetical protein